MKKTGRKRESSARSATSALTISGVGIRSTVIIWTGQRNLAARGNLRDGRGPLPRLSPLLSLSPSPPPVPIRIPTHQTVLPSSLFHSLAATPTPRKLSTRAVCMCVCVCAKILKRRSFTFPSRLRTEPGNERIKKKKRDSKERRKIRRSLLFPFIFTHSFFFRSREIKIGA